MNLDLNEPEIIIYDAVVNIRKYSANNYHYVEW